MERKVDTSRLEVHIASEVTTVHFRGPTLALHEEDAQEVANELLRLADAMNGGTLVVSLAGVTFLTSTMLGKLMALHKKLHGSGAKLVLCELRPEVQELFTIAGLHRVLDIRPDDCGRAGLPGP
jgi:anti-anti-sigma factor